MNQTADKKVLFVTDQGSVKIGPILYHPGQEIDINVFRGREAALRELIANNQVARRPGSYKVTPSGKVVKFRSSEAPPLPAEIDEYDPKTKREQRPIRSETPHNADVQMQLAQLAKEQREVAAKKAAEKAQQEAEECARKQATLEAERAAAPEPIIEDEATVEEPSLDDVIEGDAQPHVEMPAADDAEVIFDELVNGPPPADASPNDELSDDEFFGDLLDDDEDEDLEIDDFVDEERS